MPFDGAELWSLSRRPWSGSRSLNQVNTRCVDWLLSAICLLLTLLCRPIPSRLLPATYAHSLRGRRLLLSYQSIESATIAHRLRSGWRQTKPLSYILLLGFFLMHQVSLGASQISFKVSDQSCLLYASNLVSLSPCAALSEGASISCLRFSLSRRHCQRTIFVLERSILGDCVSNAPVRTVCEIFTDFVHPRSVNLKLHQSDALLCAADLLEHFLFLKQTASSSDEDSVNANQPAIQSVVVIAYIGSRVSVGHWIVVEVHGDGRLDAYNSLVSYLIDSRFETAHTVCEVMTLVGSWNPYTRLTFPKHIPCAQQRKPMDCGIFAAFNAHSIGVADVLAEVTAVESRRRVAERLVVLMASHMEGSARLDDLTRMDVSPEACRHTHQAPSAPLSSDDDEWTLSDGDTGAGSVFPPPYVRKTVPTGMHDVITGSGFTGDPQDLSRVPFAGTWFGCVLTGPL
jgi:hypothetical protein